MNLRLHPKLRPCLRWLLIPVWLVCTEAGTTPRMPATLGLEALLAQDVCTTGPAHEMKAELKGKVLR